MTTARHPTGLFLFLRMIRLALPNKGRLVGDTRDLLAEAGLAAPPSDRVLRADLGEGFEALFVRAEDVPEFVADGAADAGITGWDLVVESGCRIESLLDLGYGRCRLALAVPEESSIGSLGDIAQGCRVATSFPGLVEGFFRERNLNVEVVHVSGAAEVAPQLGIADAIVDLVSTGTTLRANGLREVVSLLESTARLVWAPARASQETDRARHVQDLAAALESVLRARGQRYVMANVPKRSLDRVREILPGLNGPTVLEILNGGSHAAVHAVVSGRALYRTLANLRALGAEGILVTRIERLLP